jgi:hypothetical protein
LKRLLTIVVLIPVAMATPFSVRGTNPSNPYPNELPGFKFYAKYLYPLHPLGSVRAEVVMVLGSDQRIEAGKWWISSAFSVSIDRLSFITITPRQRVSMLGVKFPVAFTHSLGGVSESGGCSCDVYSDKFGLQYWLNADD